MMTSSDVQAGEHREPASATVGKELRKHIVYYNINEQNTKAVITGMEQLELFTACLQNSA